MLTRRRQKKKYRPIFLMNTEIKFFLAGMDKIDVFFYAMEY